MGGGALLAAEAAVLAIFLVVVALLVTVFWRRRLIMRTGDVSPCAVRPGPDTPWRSGLLRLGPDSLDWFPLVGLTPRPHCRWSRVSIELGIGTVDAPGVFTHPFLGEAVTVPFQADERSRGRIGAELAIPADRYTAMRAWAEAAPPSARPYSA